VGRILAADVVALLDVPHYASSAMDGWAVAGDPPWRLVEGAQLEPGEAAAIVTGGVVPPGTRGVLRSEHGESRELDGIPALVLNDEAEPGEPWPGQHIRPAAEEARASETVIASGTLLNLAHIAVAAGCGHDRLRVSARPRVELLLTGDEVVERGIPAPGQVRDSFGPTLPAFVELLGGRAASRRRVADSGDAMMAALHPGVGGPPDSDVLITTGGTGLSAVDQLRPALAKLGASLLIDGVRMRPGSPSLLARLPDGRFLVGLPGNPLAAMTGMLTLVQPLLAALRGAPLPSLGTVRLASALPSGGRGRTTLVPYSIADDVGAVPTAWRGAGMLRGLAEAHGILVCPPEGAAAGSVLETVPLPWAALA
jgi:molybdopterin molybdotransferase